MAVKPKARAGSPEPYKLLKLAILLFVLGYTALGAWLIMDIWLRDALALKNLCGLPAGFPVPVLFKSLVFAVSGGLFGSAVLDLESFYFHVSIEKDFDVQHSWGYFFAPLHSVILAAIAFALVQTGLFVFGTGGASNAPGQDGNGMANLANIAIGYLAGYGWVDLSTSIKGVIKRIFKSDKDDRVFSRPNGAGLHSYKRRPNARNKRKGA